MYDILGPEILMTMEIRTEHPYVVHVPGVCGGAAVVRGTRVPIWVLASYVQQGYATAEDLAVLFPHLTLAQIHDALSYWYDHQEEIAADLAGQDAAAAAFQAGPQ
jgi:uncharacterized protein (DUF433 family)